MLVTSCVFLVAGSLHLSLFGGTLDWAFLAVSALPLALTANLLHYIIPGLLSILFIRFQFHQKLSSLFVISESRKAGISRPVFSKCRTAHRRIFPEKGAFEYSHFLTGIPVGPKCRDGGIFPAERAAGKEREGGPAWLEVRAEDHLHRDGGELGLRGKLEAYLVSKVSIAGPS